MAASEHRRVGAGAVTLAVLLGAVIGVGASSLLPASGSTAPPAPSAEVAGRVLDRDGTLKVIATGCGQQRSASATVIGGDDGTPMLLTNAHVVRGAGTVDVLHDDGTTSAATVVGSISGRDAAVLRIEPADATTGSPAAAEPAAVGDQVVVHGYPGGERVELDATVRGAEPRSGYGGTATVLLIDVEADPGLSGGTVTDAETGEVVALVAARDPDSGHVVAYPVGELLGRALGPIPGC